MNRKKICNAEIKFFQGKLLEWFIDNGRNFPWRKKSASNYIIIISEVLLQRTKAETVAKFLPYFIKKYPSWKQLSYASEKDLQELLKPLGLFKQRGSRLYKLAQEMNSRKGRFPNSRLEVEKIPMMGQYITNAYELIILKHPVPLLDVNMARILERFFGPRKLVDIRYDPYLKKLSEKIVNHQQSIELNWAIIDYAAIVCRKKRPNCGNCILSVKCRLANTS